jgi:transposase
MKQVELYFQVRRAVRIEGLSERAAARRFGIDPRTVSKMLKFSVPPGYRRSKLPVRPKLDPFVGIIDRILEEDKSRPKKQQHTSKRIFERLRDEYGFAGGVTIVKDYVAGFRQRSREMFVPLAHPPGHAQVDFGEALGVVGGVERKIHFFAFHLPHSDASFLVAYPAETTEAFCDGHVKAFVFFGGVPKSILYDNTKIAVARILGDGRRQRTRVFTELQSHYLFEDRFGRPGRGNDKGKVEGLVGFARRNFLVPIPVFDSFEALNAYLLECCRRRMNDRLRGHDQTIGERLRVSASRAKTSRNGRTPNRDRAAGEERLQPRSAGKRGRPARMIRSEPFAENFRERSGLRRKPVAEVGGCNAPRRCEDTSYILLFWHTFLNNWRSRSDCPLESAHESPMLMNEAAII